MTAMLPTPVSRLALRATLVAGVWLGAGVAQAQIFPPAAHVVPWSLTSLPWLLYPNGKQAGPLPQTIDIPPVAWTNAAHSEKLDVFAREQPVILRVTLRIKAGSVGVALALSDGSGLLSKESVLKPSGEDVELYFRVRPGEPQSFLLVRNYAGQGLTGSVVVKSVQFVREGDLTNNELADLVSRGLH
jgi:hypothetical protein